MKAVFFAIHLITFCIIANITNNANAMRFSPFKTRFATQGSSANQFFLVENDSGEAIAAEISITTREVDEQGEETNAPVEDGRFVIYPKHIIVPPNATRSVRIQWTGNNKLEIEEAYRVIVEQLPVRLTGKDENYLKFLIKYRNAAYVTPDKAKSDVIIEKFEPVKGKNQEYKITLYNKGNAHSLLKDAEFELHDDKGKEHEFLGEHLSKDIDSALILPHRRRDFIILLPAKFTGTLKDIRLQYHESF